jgi:hypothetical protein
MRINSRRWQASILLALATVIGTSALGTLQQSSQPAHLSNAGSFSQITVTQVPRATGEDPIVGLPGTHILSLAGDHHFDVEDSRSDWQPAGAGSDLTPPTVRFSETFFRGVEPSRRLGIAAPFLSLSARARN